MGRDGVALSGSGRYNRVLKNQRARLHRRIARRLHRHTARVLLMTSSDLALRWFAMAAAACRLPILPERHVAGPLLHALGMRPTLRARLNFLWSRGYELELQWLVGTQGDRLTKEWIQRHIIPQGAVPPGGAILLTIHQLNQAAIGARLAMLLQPLGIIINGLHRPSLFLEAFGQNLFPISQRVQTLRRSLQFLGQGGYLVVAGDLPDPSWPSGSILGKRMAIPPGIIWLSQKSGKPIIPFVIVPVGGYWRLWFGDPVEPTTAAVAAAMEDLIRRAPTTWWNFGWLAWQRAPSMQPITHFHADTVCEVTSEPAGVHL